MGIGPVPAGRKALEKADLKLSDIDLVEVNEAFACQYLAVEKELGLVRSKTNVNGGAIALGHPLGASGTRLTLTAERAEAARRALRPRLGLHRRRTGHRNRLRARVTLRPAGPEATLLDGRLTCDGQTTANHTPASHAGQSSRGA
jgi:hypothetical protein